MGFSFVNVEQMGQPRVARLLVKADIVLIMQG